MAKWKIVVAEANEQQRAEANEQQRFARRAAQVRNEIEPAVAIVSDYHNQLMPPGTRSRAVRIRNLVTICGKSMAEWKLDPSLWEDNTSGYHFICIGETVQVSDFDVEIIPCFTR